jgi:tRNA(Arg) A34 adenosine deaminase TadA
MKTSREKSEIPVTDREAMELAIAEALAGVEEGQSPFGCSIVKDGRVVARAHSTVWKTCDATAHAEVNAIRKACRELGTIDLSDSVLYTTCEPCPMCYSAAHWARVSKVVFGARIRDAQAAGFNELVIPAEKMRAFSGDGMELVPDFMPEECRELFRKWSARGKGKAY